MNENRPTLPCNSRPRDERGIALILSLLILTLLVIIVFQLAYSTKIELRLGKNRLDTTVLRYATDGVFTRAKAYLAADAAENNWDAPGDLWESASFAADEGLEDYDYSDDPWGEEDAETEGQVELEVIIVDEDRKLNLALLAERPEDTAAQESRNSRNRTRSARNEDGNQNQNESLGRSPQNRAAEKKKREHVFEALISVLVEFRDDTGYDLSGTEAREIAEEIREYVTATTGQDASDGEIPRPETVDAPLLTVDELLMIPGVTEDLLFDFKDDDTDDMVVPGLLNYVTIWSSGLVNINTAPPVVLRGLFEKDKRDLAEDILDYRDEYEEAEEDEENDRGTGSSGSGSDDRIRERVSGSEERETPGIFKEVTELQTNNILDNEDYQKLLPFISTQSSVFSVYVIAKRGKVKRRTRAVFRRVNGQVYPLFFEGRKDELLLDREEEDEDDGGFFF